MLGSIVGRVQSVPLGKCPPKDQGHEDAQAEVATPQVEPLALEVHGHEDIQAEVATPQDEQQVADQPPPHRYSQRIRHPPDRF